MKIHSVTENIIMFHDSTVLRLPCLFFSVVVWSSMNNTSTNFQQSEIDFTILVPTPFKSTR